MDNSWATVSADDVSGLTSVQYFSATGTWTKPADITMVKVEVRGAGGTGAGVPTNAGVFSWWGVVEKVDWL